MRKISGIILIFDMVIALHSQVLVAQNQPKASVNVYEIAKDGSVEYSFEIVNTDANPISQFTLGMKLDPLASELVEFPRGWSATKPTSGIGSPKDWNGSVLLQEESKFYALSWDVVKPASKIKPGEKLRGFSVTLAKADKSILDATFNLYPANSPPISGKLTLITGATPHLAGDAHPVSKDVAGPANFKSCAALKHGKTTTRNRFKSATGISIAACEAQREVQTGTCDNGTLTFDGTATFKICKVVSGKSK